MLAGPSAEVHEAFKLIQEAGPDLGLELNVGKNELVLFEKATPTPRAKARCPASSNTCIASVEDDRNAP